MIVSLLMIYDTTLLMRVSKHYEVMYKKEEVHSISISAFQFIAMACSSALCLCSRRGSIFTEARFELDKVDSAYQFRQHASPRIQHSSCRLRASIVGSHSAFPIVLSLPDHCIAFLLRLENLPL
ncbi:hypothetical protein ES702_03145 [subsurface metagenome]